jgi:outer membrane lipoprotein-sorting protein
MRARLIGCAIFALSAVFAAPAKDDLQDLVARMDGAAAKFQAMTAKVHYATYVKVIEDTSEETGTVMMKKKGPGEIAGRIEFITPDKRSVLFEKRQAQVFYPKINTVQIYDLGKHGEQLDRFLMIGFGTSGTELARDYDMKVLGSETVEGKSTTRLELVPKTDTIKNVVSKLDLWIPNAPDDPYPTQEKIYQQSGDYRLVNYSDLKINPAISASALELKLPATVIKQYPQK